MASSRKNHSNGAEDEGNMSHLQNIQGRLPTRVQILAELHSSEQ